MQQEKRGVPCPPVKLRLHVHLGLLGRGQWLEALLTAWQWPSETPRRNNGSRTHCGLREAQSKVPTFHSGAHDVSPLKAFTEVAKRFSEHSQDVLLVVWRTKDTLQAAQHEGARSTTNSG